MHFKLYKETLLVFLTSICTLSAGLEKLSVLAIVSGYYDAENKFKV